jgi:hypothetical protein
MSRPSRLVLAGAVLVLALAGCGEDEAPPAADPTTSAAAPTGAAVTWAGSVCSDADALRAAVADAVAATPAEIDGTVPDQARAEITARADAVREAGEALVTTLRTPPADAGAELKTAADGLSEPAARAQTQVDAMWSAASAVAAATTPEAAEAAVGELRSAALAAGTAVSTYADELRRAVGDAEPPVRSAFGAAPECQEIPGTATPSG